ncbi:MAG TPA: hypothetical protein VF933_17260, partial [Streptosporangiaceae bacterium]
MAIRATTSLDIALGARSIRPRSWWAGIGAGSRRSAGREIWRVGSRKISFSCYPGAVAWLLADRAAARTPLDNPGAVAALLDSLRAAGAQEQVTALADRAAADVSLGDPFAVARLLDSLRAAGAQEEAAALLRRDPAAHVSLGDPFAVARL